MMLNNEQQSAGGLRARVDAPDNRQTFWIGCLAGQGLTLDVIAAHLADGTRPDAVGAILHEQGYVPPVYPAGHEPVVMFMAAKLRTKIAFEAIRRRIEMPVLVGKVLEAMCRDDLFAKVLD